MTNFWYGVLLGFLACPIILYILIRIYSLIAFIKETLQEK